MSLITRLTDCDDHSSTLDVVRVPEGFSLQLAEVADPLGTYRSIILNEHTAGLLVTALQSRPPSARKLAQMYSVSFPGDQMSVLSGAALLGISVATGAGPIAMLTLPMLKMKIGEIGLPRTREIGEVMMKFHVAKKANG